jgi:hypothetical protein
LAITAFAVRGVALAQLGTLANTVRTLSFFVRIRDSNPSDVAVAPACWYLKCGRSRSAGHSACCSRQAARARTPIIQNAKLLPEPQQSTHTIADTATVQHAASSITVPASAALVRHTQPSAVALRRGLDSTESCTCVNNKLEYAGKPEPRQIGAQRSNVGPCEETMARSAAREMS